MAMTDIDIDGDTATNRENPDATPVPDVGGIAADRLRSFVERIERLETEKKGIADDIKEVYSEAGGTGFDPRIIRIVVRLRKKAKEERQEEEELIGLYRQALDMD